MAKRKAKLEPSRFSAPLLTPSKYLPSAPDIHTFGQFISSTGKDRVRRTKLTRLVPQSLLDTLRTRSYLVRSTIETKPVQKQARFVRVQLPTVAACQEDSHLETPAESRGLRIRALAGSDRAQATSALVERVRHSMQTASRASVKIPYYTLIQARQISHCKQSYVNSLNSSESGQPMERSDAVLSHSKLERLGKVYCFEFHKRVRDKKIKTSSVSRLSQRPDRNALPGVQGLPLRYLNGKKKASHIVVLPQAWLHE